MDALTLDVIGVRVGLTGSSADEVAALRPVLADLVDPTAAEPDVIVPTAPSTSTTSSLEDTLAHVTRAVIERSSALLLHCGGVVRNGAGVLIPGESGTGKSTMTAACLRRGFDYLTDEMAAIDTADDTVTGYVRPLMLTPWSVRAVGIEPDTAAVGKEAILPSRLGARVVRTPAPIGHVVLARRGAPVSLARPGDRGEALAAVLAAAFNHYALGARAWECAVRVAASARVWHLDVADPRSAADALAAAIDDAT